MRGRASGPSWSIGKWSEDPYFVNLRETVCMLRLRNTLGNGWMERKEAPSRALSVKLRVGVGDVEAGSGSLGPEVRNPLR